MNLVASASVDLYQLRRDDLCLCYQFSLSSQRFEFSTNFYKLVSTENETKEQSEFCFIKELLALSIILQILVVPLGEVLGEEIDQEWKEPVRCVVFPISWRDWLVVLVIDLLTVGIW